MNVNSNKELTLLTQESEQQKKEENLNDSLQGRFELLKKPIIFTLMAVVFAGCIYLIFKPSDGKKTVEDVGLNDAVPEATDAGLQSDKQKAYEQAKMEQKNEEKQSTLASLSDYWNEDTVKVKEGYISGDEIDESVSTDMYNHNKENVVLNSYKNTQDALNTFYQDDHTETKELRKEIEELKQQLSDKKEYSPQGNIDNQLALMEKSYQMAAKYLPSGTSSTEQPKILKDETPTPVTVKESFSAFNPTKKNVVSALYQELEDSVFVVSIMENRNRNFYTAVMHGVQQDVTQPRNSIRAVVQETSVVTGEGIVKLRLLESGIISKQTIPVGTVFTANARFQNGRIELKVSSIEMEGNIMLVDISAYDLNGQPGLFVPYSSERLALKDVASNMGQTTGTSLMMTQSAGQQVAGDLSRGFIQGVSGYLSKKIKTEKVTLKAGIEVLLVSKK
ncbi:conjugative transposon protein TraM [Terrimonas sp.]|nr:conjugative transposon protein TraM [Terrimonas sp.]